MTTPTDYIVIPCGATKTSEPRPAADLYTSTHFRHTLAAARAEATAATAAGRPTTVLILSARHGLLALDTVVAPYDVTMTDPDAITTAGLALQLATLTRGGEVTMAAFLPAAYRDRLTAAAAVINENDDLRDWVTVLDVYEAAPGIGYQRAAAAAVARQATNPALAAAATLPRIDVVLYRDPDATTSPAVFVDGVRHPAAYVWDYDPGAGNALSDVLTDDVTTSLDPTVPEAVRALCTRHAADVATSSYTDNDLPWTVTIGHPLETTPYAVTRRDRSRTAYATDDHDAAEAYLQRLQRVATVLAWVATRYVTVQVENNYQCGRTSIRTVQVRPPAPGTAPDDLTDWWDDEVYPHTGDAHPHDTPEKALHEARILDAPEQPRLVGARTEWEG